MKIVHLNTSDFGGAAMAAIRLHLHLLENGMESDFLTLNKTRNDIPRHFQVQPFSLKLFSRATYKIRRALEITGCAEDKSNTPFNKNLADRPEGFEIFTLPYSYFSILDHPLVQAADIVHLHWVGFGMIDERNFFLRNKKKLVWTMHDMHPFTGGCHHADSCEEFKRACGVCPQLKNPSLAAQYFTYKKQGYDNINPDQLVAVCPSNWLGVQLSASALWKNKKHRVIANGTDERIFCYRDRNEARKQLGISLEEKVLLFTAHDVNNPRKGMKMLAEVLKEMSDPDLHLICMGSNWSGDGVVQKMTSTGYIEDPGLLALYYAAADVFVLPSLAENLPNTIAEALMCGTACVAFNVGGISEMIHSENGTLVAKGDLDALRNAILQELKGNRNRKEIAQQAALRFGIQSCGAEYRKLYQEWL